jgi:hypothetical protein
MPCLYKKVRRGDYQGIGRVRSEKLINLRLIGDMSDSGWYVVHPSAQNLYAYLRVQ